MTIPPNIILQILMHQTTAGVLVILMNAYTLCTQPPLMTSLLYFYRTIISSDQVCLLAVNGLNPDTAPGA